MFEPFFSSKLDGTGMGLAISRSIIEAHDGRIWAAPSPKGGTMFHFTLRVPS
jgi:two-component system sensor kinase FixL